MEQFVYVFDEETRDKLLGDGFELIQSDEKKKVFVFLNKPEVQFTLNGVKSIQTNMISL